MSEKNTAYKLSLKERLKLRAEAKLWRKRALARGFRGWNCLAPLELIEEFRARYFEYKKQHPEAWINPPAGYELVKRKN